MNYKQFALRNALKPVNTLNSIRYPNQKERLDRLREEKYALIVFDALRYDYAEMVLPLYLNGELEPMWSAAHDTFQYGHRCWGDREYTDTYVSGAAPLHANPSFEDEFFQNLYGGWQPGDTMQNLVEAFRECWDTSLGTCNPEQLTEVASSYTEREQLAVHYFQPHAPYIGRHSILGHTNSEDAQALTGDPIDKPIWERVKRGEISHAEFELAYESNLHRAVNAALPLISELCEQKRRVVVMADHGELLGRYHRKLVSHPRISMPQIRKVPWMEVTGVKEYPTGGEIEAESMKEKLEALGYR